MAQMQPLCRLDSKFPSLLHTTPHDHYTHCSTRFCTNSGLWPSPPGNSKLLVTLRRMPCCCPSSTPRQTEVEASPPFSPARVT